MNKENTLDKWKEEFNNNYPKLFVGGLQKMNGVKN